MKITISEKTRNVTLLSENDADTFRLGRLRQEFGAVKSHAFTLESRHGLDISIEDVIEKFFGN